MVSSALPRELITDGSLYAGCADGCVRQYEQGEGEEPSLKATYQLSRRQIDQISVLPVTNQLVVLAGTSQCLPCLPSSTFPFGTDAPDSTVTLHKLENLSTKGYTTTLSQARYAQSFATTTYLAPRKAVEGEATPTKVSRDLLVIGCSKKVVVYGGGSRLGEAWELSLQHSPRHVIFPTPVYADLPSAVHLLYSPHSSVILHIKSAVPLNQRLAVTELPATGYPVPKSGLTRSASPAESAGWGVGRLGGFMRSAAIPVGTRTVGGEVVLVRDGELSPSRQS